MRRLKIVLNESTKLPTAAVIDRGPEGYVSLVRLIVNEVGCTLVFKHRQLIVIALRSPTHITTTDLKVVASDLRLVCLVEGIGMTSKLKVLRAQLKGSLDFDICDTRGIGQILAPRVAVVVAEPHLIGPCWGSMDKCGRKLIGFTDVLA